ncbi:MAG: hypothetical protein A2283_06465 [Lentisphaerae bacterium RIFOXYA12_FULL_48_11]|nr:MAG: hypothetical protein A2283_06465 [Lentisphaerae bacterium RIFOXYA12_FULL_48_11]
MGKIWICFVIVMSCVLGVLLSGCEMGDSSTSSENSVLAISPATVYLNASKASVVQFTAAGGDGNYTNYTWSVSTNSLGVIYDGGETALYQSTTNTGVNTVWVVDSSGNVGSATVTQE